MHERTQRAGIASRCFFVVAVGVLGLKLCFTAAVVQATEPLVADLSDHLIAITTGFTGAKVVMFGAIEDEGDVVVTVRGPPTDIRVREKSRIAGVWMNRDSLVFRNTPAFYSVASSDQRLERVPEVIRGRHEIGVEHLRLSPDDAADEGEVAQFTEALRRRKIASGVWLPEIEPVNFLGPRLFRTALEFPSNVPTGTYSISVLLVRDNAVVSAQTTPLVISKTGVGAEVFTFAFRQAALYGLLAITLAISAGWGAALIFRR